MCAIGLLCDYPAAPATTPHKTSSPLTPFYSYPSLYLCTFQSVCDCICFLLFASIPIVVDHLLYLFLYSIYYLVSSRGNISIVFKIGSTVLQRTIYDPILEAILIPKYTYFHPQNLKIFHF